MKKKIIAILLILILAYPAMLVSACAKTPQFSNVADQNATVGIQFELIYPEITNIKNAKVEFSGVFDAAGNLISDDPVYFTAIVAGTYDAAFFYGSARTSYKIRATNLPKPVISLVSDASIYEVGDTIRVKTPAVSGGTGEKRLDTVVRDVLGQKVTLTDNKFVAQSAGKYTIEFTATDARFQTATASYQVTVIDTLPDALFLSIPNTQVCVQGQAFTLVYPTAINSGGSSLVVTASMLAPKTAEDTADPQETVVSAGSITLSKVGEYVFTYSTISMGKQANVSQTVIVGADVKATLAAAISYAQTLSPSSHTKTSADALSAALATAQSVNSNSSATQVQLAAALSGMQDALKNMVSYTRIWDMIEKTKNYVEEDYSESTWAIMTSAVQNAQATIAQTTPPTQAQVDAALRNLFIGIRSLSADKTELLNIINQAMLMLVDGEESYSSSTWAFFMQRYNEAVAVNNNPKAIQSAVELAIINLQLALNTLQPDKTELALLLSTQGTLNQADYSESSWAAYQLALQNAQAVNNNENATQSQINSAVIALRGAINALRADKSTLNALILEAELLEVSEFTSGTWAQLALALASAREVVQDATATQSQVATAVATLSAAIDGLLPINVRYRMPQRMHDDISGSTVTLIVPEITYSDGTKAPAILRSLQRGTTDITSSVSNNTIANAAVGNYTATFEDKVGQNPYYVTFRIWDANAQGNSESAPKAIANEAALRTMQPTGHYVLIRNITLTSAWTPIHNFSGTLNGNHYTISGLTVSNQQRAALFASAVGGFKIYDLMIEEADISAQHSGSAYAAVLVAQVNIEIDPTVKGFSISNVQITSSNVSATSTLNGDAFAGALIGTVWYIHNGSQANTLEIKNIKVQACKVSATANTSNKSGAYAGGFIGYYYGISPFVSQGLFSGISLTQSTFDGNVLAHGNLSAFAGGLFGYCDLSNSNRSAWINDVEQFYNETMIVAEIDQTATYGTVIAHANSAAHAGGLAGYLEAYLYTKSSIKRSYSEAAVTASAKQATAGGLIGRLFAFSATSDFTMLNCYSRSTVNSGTTKTALYQSWSGVSFAPVTATVAHSGGVFGYVDADATLCNISSVYSAGVVMVEASVKFSDIFAARIVKSDAILHNCFISASSGQSTSPYTGITVLQTNQFTQANTQFDSEVWNFSSSLPTLKNWQTFISKN